jgi:4-hydroxyphenylpyruvate dioxygenase
MVAASERARAEARGPLVARMDADDVALPERFELQAAAIEEEGLAAVGGRVEYFPDPSDGLRAYADWLNSLVTVEAALGDVWVECPLPGPGLTARAELLSYRDRGWPEDYDLVLRIWEGGGRFRNVEALVHRWRDHPERLTRTTPAYTLDAFRRCKVHFLRRTLLADRRPAVVWGAGPTGKALARELLAGARRSPPSSRSTRGRSGGGSTALRSSPSSAPTTSRGRSRSAPSRERKDAPVCASSPPISVSRRARTSWRLHNRCMAEDFMPLLGWDHVELWVGNAKQAAYFYEHAMGFTRTAYAGPETGVRDRASYVLEQEDIRFVLTSAVREEHEITRHHAKHGDGVRDIALTVPDATEAYRQAVSRGARSVAEPQRDEDEFGVVERSAIATYGDTIHTFVNRADYAGPFLPGYVSVSENGHASPGVGLTNIDHVVGNVELGKMDFWVEFYERVFGMTNIIHFGDDDIQTEYSALMSKVMADGSGKVKFPINEPAEGKRKSQIQEYLDFYGSAGAQHIALASTDIVATVETLKERGFLFLDTPDSYYEEAPVRVGEITEDYVVLQEHKILVDRDDDGYLLQIFTKTAQDRPTVFFEVIERHGATTFGEGNFKALFEAIEREQALRGNL